MLAEIYILIHFFEYYFVDNIDKEDVLKLVEFGLLKY